MEVKKYHETLKKMFPELSDCEPCEDFTTPSYNDGGTIVRTVWEGPGRHLMTEFNNWCIESPCTTVKKVERYQHKEWRYRDLEKARYYER